MDCEFVASLAYTVRICLETNKKVTGEEQQEPGPGPDLGLDHGPATCKAQRLVCPDQA